MKMNSLRPARTSNPHLYAAKGLSATAVAIVVLTATCESSAAGGDAGRGEKVYEDCMACHSLQKNGVGPMHRAVFGRKAGTVGGYDYSGALKNSGLVWDTATLDKWLVDPQALIPGTK